MPGFAFLVAVTVLALAAAAGIDMVRTYRRRRHGWYRRRPLP